MRVNILPSRPVLYEPIVPRLRGANEINESFDLHGVTIAEDVSGMPGLCRPMSEGGIGFDYRLGMAIPDFWIKMLKEKQDEEWSMYEMWDVLTNRLSDVKTIAYCESHDQALVGDQTIAFRLMQSRIYFHMMKEDNDLVVDRGIALHKMIRLFTIALGGTAYLNFMGNEFGHPDWIDFPREGNNWSYEHARRMWSLVEDKNLKYHYLGAFDKAMLKLIQQYDVLQSDYGNQLYLDDWNKTIIFERHGLIFIFNFHINMSAPDYEFPIPEPGDYQIVLSTDDPVYGGHGRVTADSIFITLFNESDNTHKLKIYNTNRTAMVLKRI